MEGLIPYVYKAIVQYRNGGGAPLGGTWFNESPPASYIRLPGGSGRFRASEIRQRSALCTSPPSPVAAVKSAPYRASSRRPADLRSQG